MGLPHDQLPDNATVVERILKAFNNKEKYEENNSSVEFPYSISVDYTKNQGEIICYISGHVHYDKIEEIDGITYINQLNSRATQDHTGPTINTPERVMDTDSQEALSVYKVDRENRKIYIIKHGAGEDAQINY